MTTPTIKPCWWCGSKCEANTGMYTARSGPQSCFVYCQACGAMSPVVRREFKQTIEDVRAKAIRIHNEGPSEAMIEGFNRGCGL